jgi:hypothetical protein
MKKLCSVVALMGAFAAGQGMASGAPDTRWPQFDEARLQQIVDVFAANGITACPDEVRAMPDSTGRTAHQTIGLYASARWLSCPRHRPVTDPTYNRDEDRATYYSEALIDIQFYATQKAFDRGVTTWKRKSLHWPIVGWSWKPVVLGLNAGYADVVNAVVQAMKTLPGPKVLFDDS